MILQLFKLVGITIILLLTQSLVLNHIHFLGYATPLIYVYAVLKVSRFTPRWQQLLFGFFIGWAADTFTDTMGVSAIATTALAMFMTPTLNLFVDADNNDDFLPGTDTMGWSAYARFLFMAVLFHHIIYFIVEAFSFSDWSGMLTSCMASVVFTCALILAIEAAFAKRR